MNFYIMTLFPEFFHSFFSHSIVKKAYEKKVFDYKIKNIRDRAINKYGQVDDEPYGGGAGMVLRPEPIFECYEDLNIQGAKKTIFFSPKGRKIDHNYIIDLTKIENIVLICGHYEGVDQRVIDFLVDEQVSIGDFVITGGELPAMILMDSVVRQLKGTLKEHSLNEESFTNGLLEYRQWTRPNEYKNLTVPDVLISGNHKEIDKYRLKDSIEETFKYRPDLFERFERDFYKGIECSDALYDKKTVKFVKGIIDNLKNNKI